MVQITIINLCIVATTIFESNMSLLKTSAAAAVGLLDFGFVLSMFLYVKIVSLLY